MRRVIHLSIVILAVASVTVLSSPQSSPAAKTVPTIDDLISLKRAGSPVISPDGRLVAYTVRETMWDENVYKTEIWIADVQAGTTRQLTHSAKSSSAPAWSPDGKRLAFSSDRTDKGQIYMIDPAGGEAEALTSGDEGAGRFQWSPDGASIAFTRTDPQTDAMKEREKQFGQFDVIDADYRMTHLYAVDTATKKVRRLTQGAFTVGAFNWSPDGKQIAFDHRINGANANGGTADISVLDVASSAVRAIVTQDGPDTNPMWSPNGAQIAFETKMANPDYFFSNTRIAAVPSAGGAIEVLTSSFDEDPSIVAWNRWGIFFSASNHTNSSLYICDLVSKSAELALQLPTRMGPQTIASAFNMNRSGEGLAYVGSSAGSFPEVYAGSLPAKAMKKLTDLGAQTKQWPFAPPGTMSWKSQDGTTIEGVLHTPPGGMVPGRKYPLLVVIHGGPTGVSRPVPYSSASTYPIDVWVNRGAIVLEPNYRGSAGYGEKFRSLNVRNLGVGDAWDVLSGIDALIAQGRVDPNQVGVMGWSQGGYISAFLTTHDSARFKAVSVGAGISDWMTYYVNTDITPFTRQYLKGTPWDDPDIYAKTSPITYIKGAKAPTLIQHGATDQRVPLPDAFELYHGLLDQHVPTKLIVYKGFEGVGHGPSKPKSSRAVMQHNLEWFDKYLFAK